MCLPSTHRHNNEPTDQQGTQSLTGLLEVLAALGTADPPSGWSVLTCLYFNKLLLAQPAMKSKLLGKAPHWHGKSKTWPGGPASPSHEQDSTLGILAAQKVQTPAAPPPEWVSSFDTPQPGTLLPAVADQHTGSSVSLQQQPSAAPTCVGRVIQHSSARCPCSPQLWQDSTGASVGAPLQQT